jgi:protein-L-isoaspartate(D-aspartate) O-methyltransferase
MAVPQRSHVTFSSALRLHGGGVEDGFDRMGRARRSCRSRWKGFMGSGIGRDYKLNAMDFTAARERMVASQIVARGLRDPRVVEAMRDIPRHLFVPADARVEAYEDRPLPIGCGQTISQPYMVAIMTATLAVEPEDRVLEIGTGSGYQAAVLARLARSVISIERHPALAARAAATLHELGAANVEVVTGDGSRGYPPAQPYNRILVTAGAPAIPESLKSQLADGGRLVIPVGPEGYQRLMLIRRAGGGFTEVEGEGCVFVPLIGEEGWPGRDRCQSADG